jgi:hypothetical protein
MRSFILALSVLCASVIGARAEAPTLDGAWVLSEKWNGYMGIALVIKSNEFRYWFYSDVQLPKEPTYPITGKVELDGDTIRLLPSITDAHLYHTNWHLVVHKGEICLLAESHLRDYRSGKPFPDDRLLYKIDDFDEKKPVMNRRRKRE